MLMIYLICLGVGGAMVLLSALGGVLEPDADLDPGVDADADTVLTPAPAAGSDALVIDAAQAWLPLTSLRFWTFASTFFGLTGVLLTQRELASPLSATFSAAAVGYAAGTGICFALRRLQREVVTSAVRDDDFIGSSAVVLLPVGPGAPGQVRVQLGGLTVDRVALTDDAITLPIDSEVLVYGTREDGSLLVTLSTLGS